MNAPFMAATAAVILNFFLLLYMLTMAIDVGGGMIALWARWRHHDEKIGATILHYVSPVWETSNVFRAGHSIRVNLQNADVNASSAFIQIVNETGQTVFSKTVGMQNGQLQEEIQLNKNLTS